MSVELFTNQLPTTGSMLGAIAKVANRDEAAVVYAIGIRKDCGFTEWKTVNAAIVERWSLFGLDYIKRKAWKAVVGLGNYTEGE